MKGDKFINICLSTERLCSVLSAKNHMATFSESFCDKNVLVSVFRYHMCVHACRNILKRVPIMLYVCVLTSYYLCNNNNEDLLLHLIC